MKILFISDNYPPEMNANARIVFELSSYWSKLGQNVSVLTSHPNFPRGIIYAGYRNNWCCKTNNNGIEVIRVKTYMAPNKGIIKRILDFCSFGLSSFFFGIFQFDCNVIIGITPQLLCAASACILSMVKRRPFVLILCDLWAQAISSTNTIKNKFLIKILKKIELLIYKKSRLIIILSPSFKKYLIKNGEMSKIFTSISGVDSIFCTLSKDPAIVSQYKLQNKIVVSYIGTFGIFHNHQEVIEILHMFRERLMIFFIDDGACREKIEFKIMENKLNNIIIDGPFAASGIPQYWSVADIGLVLLSDVESIKTVIPSKMLEIMAMGKPIILYGPEGKAKKFLDQSGGGIYVKAGERENLVETLITLSHNHFMRTALGAEQKYFLKIIQGKARLLIF